jgi:hypothetical protein
MNTKIFFHFILTLILLIGISSKTSAFTGIGDSLKIASNKITSLSKEVDSLKMQIKVINEKITEPQKIECTGKFDTPWKWLIVFFMPVTMLFFSFVFFIVFYRSKEFKLANLIGIDSKSGNENETTNNVISQSTSRFIALMTGLTAIFVSTTLTMYYGYMMVAQCNNALDLEGLWKILAGLGIGIIPYGINVWNRNLKEEAATGKSNNSTTPQT